MPSPGLGGPRHLSVGPITAAVFDLGGVLIEWDPRYLYRQLFEDETAMERFLREVCTPDWNRRQDEGRPWAEAIASLAAEHPDQRALIAAYRDRWVETLGGAVDGTTAILDDVRRAGVRPFALSNWSAETFPIARPRFPFLESFEGIVLSGEVGIAKPDSRIFEHLLARYELDAASTVFIDDSPENVQAAVALGMIGLRFSDARSLREELVGLGVLPAVGSHSHGLRLQRG
jgi:2-haloacid dehalogenase